MCKSRPPVKRRKKKQPRLPGGRRWKVGLRKPSPPIPTPEIYRDISLHYQGCHRCDRFGEQRFELVLCSHCKKGFHHSCIAKGYKAPLVYADLSTWKCSECKALESQFVSSLGTFIIKKEPELEIRVTSDYEVVPVNGTSQLKKESDSTAQETDLKPRMKLFSVDDIGLKLPPRVMVSDKICKSLLLTDY